ncbi:MAG TPA: hypothetical protein VMW46_01740 [Candidatus Desulfaltia sp.]|nr:hypothetical protein [Candidatus Desulfaltia sp.]
MGIPYQAIGIGLGFLLGVWAFIEADTAGGRVFIASTMIVIFLLPVVWQFGAAGLISFILWMVFAAGCYIFLKLRGVGVP